VGSRGYWRVSGTFHKIERNKKCPSRRSLSIRRFWGNGGKMEAKKGESFLQLSPPSPLPPPPSKISSPLAPSVGGPDTQATRGEVPGEKVALLERW